MQPEEVIDEIQKVRGKNNTLWMNILKIAFRSSPEETKALFKEVAENDSRIVELSKELAK